MTSILELVGVNKYFKSVHAVKDVSFNVEEGEFISLLGPSGCGKTTTLRMIAGFEEVSKGSIILSGREVTNIPPYQRNTGMVFQNYALFPHMTVENNIKFGLKMRKVDKALIPERINRALKLIHLEDYGQRFPRELSGGQQQRVALARALAIEPSVLLLDEPLSNLDAKLRVEMRVEIKQIQEKIGITTVFVTHDQEEALTMSDRIIVMNCGEMIEIGSPFEIYTRPKNPFTGKFIGNTNIFHGKVEGCDNLKYIIKTDHGLAMKGCCLIAEKLEPGREVIALIRQECISVSQEKSEFDRNINIFSAELNFISFLGSNYELICDVNGHRITIRRPNEGRELALNIGQTINIGFEYGDCLIIPK